MNNEISEKYAAAKVEHLEEEEVTGADFGGATLTIIHSDTETSPYDPTVNDKLFAPEKPTVGASNTEINEDESEVNTAAFFSTRTGAFENAVAACRPIILPNLDGDFCGEWLLTEIDHWDAEKERIVLLTKNTIIIVKYDFIALKVLDYKRVNLVEFDHIVIGEFTYPQTSVVPKVERMVDLVKGLVFNWSKKRSNPPPRVLKPGSALCVQSSSRHRSTKGVRAMWNKGERVEKKDSWNPWSRSIPFLTLTSHPFAPDNTSTFFFDIDHFIQTLVRTIEELNVHSEEKESGCVIEEKPILIESYLGLVSMLHNVNNLGFFKLRGKVSF